jgi:cyclic pyranopterin phosphate synthase
VPKGDVGAVARVAGIMAAKRTSEIVPLCHPLPLDRVAVDVEPQPDRGRVAITATAETSARTGVEMEALTAVVAAALSVYDMLKGIDRGLAIEGVAVVEKRKDDPRPGPQG